MRHAKSSWSNAGRDDFDRPLNQRGRRAAPLIGAELRRRGLRPDYVLCSTARRTTETWELMAGEDWAGIEARFADELYLAGADEILRAVRAAPDTRETLLVIAHNPGLHALAVRLSGTHGARRLAEKFPTAAVAIFRLESDRWPDAGPETVHFQELITPRSLSD